MDILDTELRSFCTFSDPIQIVARDQSYDEIFNRVATSGSGLDSITSSLGSESGSNGALSQSGSPGVCKTPEQQRELAYTQPAEPRIYPEPQQGFAFDFDVGSGLWVSADPYAQLGNNLPKDQPDWLIQGLSLPGPFA